MVNIKVAVRIRPLSQRELLRGEEVVVRKENKFVLVTNPKISEKQDGDSRQKARRFSVDVCYDFKDSEGCSQEAVYKEIGLEVLHSMFNGFNACVLAYGHSASGKTYTIMGLQDDPGLTPRLCQGLFDKLNEERSDDKIRVQVIISFLEIYNEKVRDLLGSKETGTTSGNVSLRVREHPKLGPYVQGLSQHLVTDKTKLVGLLTIGNRRRSTAATENNAHSSRSHAVFTIQFKQCDGENYETDKSSKVHLVDLAGSEKANSSQNKARLKEGANINKSLVTLGNVISVLAESYDSEIFLNKQCGSKTWQPFVPYRDSILTWLLKDTLGGNSNTIMIATISPASGSISETVNTLRYAERTKRIVNQPMMNEDPKIRTIRQLRKEIAQLKCLLLSLHSCGSWFELEESYSESQIVIPNPERKWLDSGGRKIAVKEVNINNNDNSKKVLTSKEIGVIQTKSDLDERKRKKAELVVPTRGEKYDERGVFEQRTASSGSDACKINDEKKSDVNGSVNDNFSHETQIFSDSLEGFSSFFLKSENSCDVDAGADDDTSRLHRLTKYACELGELPSENLKFFLTREFGSCDNNMPKKDLSEMIRRSRPDLIKGISSRSNERLLSRSSPSCTGLSDINQSGSECSLISSESTEKQSPEKMRLWNPGSRNWKSLETGIQGEVSKARREHRNEVSPISIKKNEKRSEIVNAVTSRLYVTKRKLDRKVEICQKKDDEDEEREELKLCRRARMKLFDLGRKLAMTRKIKKTMDNDSQTDSIITTLRLKEKGVTTDGSGAASLEGVGIIEESSKEEEKPCVIMNQVFIPRASNYLVECGKIIRIEAPEVISSHEAATQTAPEQGNFKNANTSPIRFCNRDEDSFSEDSLDSEDKGKATDQNYLIKGRKTKNESESEGLLSECGTYLPCDSEAPFRNGLKTQYTCDNRTGWHGILFDEMYLGISTKEKVSPFEEISFVPAYFSSSSLEESRRDDNPSSENSFTSAEGADISCSSETSSEDFVFYENPKDKDSVSKMKTTRERQLYTITENSEPSDPSDALSPIPYQLSFLTIRDEDEKDEKRGNILRHLLQSVKTQNPNEDQMKRVLKTFDQPKKAWEYDKHDKVNSELIRARKENTKISTEYKDRLNVFGNSKSKTEKLKTQESVSHKTPFIAPEKVNRVPNNTSELKEEKDSVSEEVGRENLNCLGNRTDSENIEPRSNQTTWKDLDSCSQKQYLNLNISNSSRAPPFSVHTHLFDESLRKDQSMDTMFNSSDSITFVFMGPAKPKTSVLLEIIRRSLGNNSFPSEKSYTREKSRNKGVQCGASLMRSVSVDTAIIALSRIAKNQEPTSGLHRSSSLGALSSNVSLISLEEGKLQSQRNISSQCNFDVECLKSQKKKPTLKFSVGTSTSAYKLDGNEGIEVEKSKKSVSWCGEKKHLKEMKSKALGKVDEDASEFDLSRKGLPELKASAQNAKNVQKFLPPNKKSGLGQERRVRFLKPETSATEPTGEPMESIMIFLNEAIQLLRKINLYSAKYPMLPDEETKTFSFESSKEMKENGKTGVREFEDPGSCAPRNKTENFVEKGASRRLKKGTESKADENLLNFTWPRRTPTGKPPTGTKPKFSASPSFSPSDFPHFSNFVDLTANSSAIHRGKPNAQSWKHSNFSVDLSNSHKRENQSRSPCLRFSYGEEMQRLRGFYSQPDLSSRAQASKPNFDTFSEMESELEESCRRLEMVTEQDKMRERILKNQKTGLECHRYKAGTQMGNFNAEEECKKVVKKERKVLKRRKMEECVGSCSCKTSRTYPCKYLWSKGCQSTFELDSFGPGSAHCRQLCMFCRKKNTEVYYSALSLNSECVSANFCRLNFYGFCPCSSYRLNNVTSSPRAYMQHLLGLRRQIVSETKRDKLDSVDRNARLIAESENFRSHYWGHQTEFFASQKFS